MPSSDERPEPSKSRKDEDNPFIVFRRFADEQMANLLHGFVGLPSAITSQSSAARWRPYDDEVRRRRMYEYDQEYERLNQEHERLMKDSPEFRSTRPYQALPDEIADTERTETEVRIPVKIFVGRQDDDAEPEEALRCPYRPLGQSLPRQHGIEGRMRPWPYGYFVNSQYSPVNLQQQEHFCDHGSRWMDAFKDLLSYEEEKEPPEELRHALQHPDSFWMRLVAAPSFDPALKSWLKYNLEKSSSPESTAEDLASRQAENDAEVDETTELDVYERLFEKQRSEKEAQSSVSMSVPKTIPVPESQAVSATAPSQQSSTLGIVSTLTTTERVALPDGTVHTKVVLKRRFADGREESSETLHTTQGGSPPEELSSGATATPPSRSEPRLGPPDMGKHNTEWKGWFWS